MRHLLIATCTLPLYTLGSACRDEGCLRGNDPECIVPTPCAGLAWTCDDTTSDVHIIESVSDPLIPGGLDTLAAPGDVILANSRIVAVIEALDHPHYLGASGGNLVDLAIRGADNDSLRQILPVVGLLPNDAPIFTRLRTFEEADGTVAVQVHGALDGRPDVQMITRFELRPCEPGLRVRTELINGSDQPLPILLGDGWYWGGRETLPFTPGPGEGFTHPSFGLSTVTSALRTAPYMAGAVHVDPAAGYAVVACDTFEVQGFHSEEVSLVGQPKGVLMPRDVAVFERFIAVSDGPSTQAATDLAFDVRQQLFGEPYVDLVGRVSIPAEDTSDRHNLARAQVIISEGRASDAPEDRIPWTHVVPAADGSFTARIPPGRHYLIEVEAFGQVVAHSELQVGKASPDPVDIAIPAVGALTVNVSVDGSPDHALVFVRPATDQGKDDLEGLFLGHFRSCAPMLGHPFGSSPACDRVLVNGPTTVAVPPGDYEVFAVGGPFTTLARQSVTISASATASVSLDLWTLPVQPPGTLSGDFHVHSSPSFDSSLGPIDRVRSFLASRIEVIATTEHDVVSTFGAEVAALGATGRLAIIDGTESTGHILFPLFPESSFPRVIGHFNFWPVPWDLASPWRGAAWDELKEPGALMTAMEERGWPADWGIAQLNHPYGGFQFGRDFGWADAIDLDLTQPLPKAYDGSGPSLFLRTPAGSAFSNADFHSEEVMNGSDNLTFLAYRALWFYLLDHGLPRTGTANSDSHSLSDNVLGFPRNLVWTSTTVDTFDPRTFNEAIRAGRLIGTNGPVIEISTVDHLGATITPSLTPFQPQAGASLAIRVSAAPWVPVDEVRIWANGALVKTIDQIASPVDELGFDGLVRLDTTIPLADLLPVDGDGWIVVEAGHALQENADLDCNGFPDTGDNNGDGTINWMDVAELTEDPEVECLPAVGPLAEPDKPERGEPGYGFRVVVPEGYPLAFTNPLLLDPDGDGYEGVSR